MSGIIDRAIVTALRVINLNGEPVTWIRAAAPVVADPSKPWIATAGVPTEIETSLLFTSAKYSPILQLIAGSNVELGKLQALLPATGFVPSDSDVVLRSDGTKLSIESVAPLAPNGKPILYYLVFKK